MARYRKRPVVIEAIRWTGENVVEVFEWAETGSVVHDPDAHALLVQTLEGRMRVSQGDWLIRGVWNELYPCADGNFQASYEAVEDVLETTSP